MAQKFLSKSETPLAYCYRANMLPVVLSFPPTYGAIRGRFHSREWYTQWMGICVCTCLRLLICIDTRTKTIILLLMYQDSGKKIIAEF